MILDDYDFDVAMFKRGNTVCPNLPVSSPWLSLSPNLLLHAFVGAKVEKLAEKGAQMGARTTDYVMYWKPDDLALEYVDDPEASILAGKLWCLEQCEVLHQV